jgi:hypothetical protein
MVRVTKQSMRQTKAPTRKRPNFTLGVQSTEAGYGGIDVGLEVEVWTAVGLEVVSRERLMSIRAVKIRTGGGNSGCANHLVMRQNIAWEAKTRTWWHADEFGW